MFSGAEPLRPSWIFDLHNFSLFRSRSHPVAKEKVSAQSDLRFGKRCRKLIFKMAAVVAILDSLSAHLAILYLITKTRLYNFDPFKPHFYIVKLGFTGVYIIFLISAQNIDCGYSLEPPHRSGSNDYPQSICFQQKYEKYRNFLSENFHFLVVKFSVYLNRHVFVMS